MDNGMDKDIDNAGQDVKKGSRSRPSLHNTALRTVTPR